MRTTTKGPKPYTNDEALALFLDAHFTVHQYKLLQSGVKESGSNMFPPYYALQNTKKMCYPSREAIKVTEISAEVKLQELLDQTIQRIVKTREEVLALLSSQHDPLSLTLVCKWGCDGSSGNSVYKQRFETKDQDDENMFLISLVPLQLNTNEAEIRIVWQNPRTSSTRFCRPAKFLLKKETPQLIKEETHKVQQQIDELSPTELLVGENVIEIHHNLLMTMVDGKVCNVLAENKSSQRCYICGALPKDMNNDPALKSSKDADPTKYSFGLSPLHAWIRCFECLIHIAYRLDIRQWQIRGANDKSKCEARKKP